MTYPESKGKERVGGGRAIAKSPGATDRQRSRTGGRNSSAENRQLSFLRTHLSGDGVHGEHMAIRTFLV